MRITALALLVALAACGSTRPDSDEKAATLDADCKAAITDFKNRDSTMVRWFDTAHAYAVFPSVGKGGAGVGGAYGRGQVYKAGKLIGYTTMKQATAGLQLGGQEFSEVIFFQDKNALDAFTEGNYQLTAQASAVAVKEGASAASAYSDGVKVFTVSKAGLMAEAAVGGQKFAYESK